MRNYSNYPSSARPIEIEMIRGMTNQPLTQQEEIRLNNLLRSPTDSNDAFISKPAAQWLQTDDAAPDAADTLFGDFWYHGELCIMFADTNVGKSILAVQIGNALSKAQGIPG